MADINEDDDEGFTFGDFVFAHPQPPPPPINGVSLSPHNVHPFISNSNPAHPSHNRVDPDPFVFSRPKGALPLSLFGQIEVEDEVEDNDHDAAKSGKIDHLLNYGFNFNYNNNINNTNGGKSNGEVDPNLKIVSGNGSSLNFINGGDDGGGGDDDDDGDDDWEFMDAVSGNGDVVQQNIQDHGGSGVVSGVMPVDHQAGQNASNSIEPKPGFNGFYLQSDDLFAALPKDMNKASEKDVMFDAFLGAGDIDNRSVSASSSIQHKSGSSSSLPQSNDVFGDSLLANTRSSEIDVGLSNGVITNGFTWDAFSGSEKIGNGGTSAISVEHEPHSGSVVPQFDNLFAAPLKADNKSSEMDIEFKPTTVTISSSGFDAFPKVREISNRSTLSATSSSSAEQQPHSSSFLFPSNNLFAVTQGAVDEPGGMFGGFKNTSSTTNGFMFDAFPEVERGGNENGLSAAPAAATANGDDDYDDFGDFIDASQEVKTGEQDKPTLPLNSKEALPLSLFGDITEETSETLNHSDELFHKQTSYPGNGFSGQGSMVSIHDLITNLYSQAQSIQSVDSKVELAENGVHNIQEEESPSLDEDEDDEWDSNTWEFKGSFRESGVGKQPSSAIPGNVGQIQLEVSQNVQDYIYLYTELRNSLCFLLSCQLDELQKARCPDTENCIAEVPETLDNEILNARELLEQGVSHIVSEKYLDKSSCLNEVVNILEEPKFKIIELEFSVSKKLELAVNDWRVTADLLRHAISILQSLSLGSADEQCRYASTWSNIIGVCAQELRSGAVIWKRASEMKVKHQVLLDSRGQNHILALGEIYKAVELLGLSAKVYKAWMLFSVSDSSQFVGLLNECRDLWSSSGLEETLQSLSDDIGDGCDESAKALLASIKNIRDFDVLPVYECVFYQRKSICQLSLLPQEMLPELETVTWNGAIYFLRLANLWANLISFEQPQLPHVQVN